MSARLSLSDVIERLTEKGGQASCVTLSRNAKGEDQFEVKVYTDGVAILTPSDAEQVAREIYDRLSVAYAYGGNGTADATEKAARAAAAIARNRAK